MVLNPQIVTVQEVFESAGLIPSGPVCWRVVVDEDAPGVYVVAVVSDSRALAEEIDISGLPEKAAKRWLPLQPIVYIGRTKRSLRRRISEFYRHQHGQRRPHCGGQDVILLSCGRWVFWAPTQDDADAEKKMIDLFKSRVGQLPFGNRMLSSRRRTPPILKASALQAHAK